jgi:hypothetical protein
MICLAGRVYLYNSILARYGTLDGSLGVEGGQYGYSVSTDGETIVVGAIGSCCNVTQRAVYVYTRLERGQWSQHGLLKSGVASTINDEFGYSVSVAGLRLAVGAPSSDVDGVNTGKHTWYHVKCHAIDSTTSLVIISVMIGRVYLYDMRSDHWSQQALLDPMVLSSEQHYGSAVSLQGEDLLVASKSTDIVFMYSTAISRPPTPAPTPPDPAGKGWLVISNPDNETTSWETGQMEIITWKAEEYVRQYYADIVLFEEDVYRENIAVSVHLESTFLEYLVPKRLKTSDDYHIQFRVYNFVSPDSIGSIPCNFTVNSTYFTILGADTVSNDKFLSEYQIVMTSTIVGSVILFLTIMAICIRGKTFGSKVLSRGSPVSPVCRSLHILLSSYL